MHAPSERRAVFLLLAALVASPSLSAGEQPAAAKAILASKSELFDAGNRDTGESWIHSRCAAAVQRVGRAMASDSRLSTASIQAEIDLYEKTKGPIPYPSEGTACALFGFQEAAHVALHERRWRRERRLSCDRRR